jgi:hypothetical protein
MKKLVLNFGTKMIILKKLKWKSKITLEPNQIKEHA